MKKNITYLSIGAAVCLICASLSSVVVFATSHSSNHQSVGSPLFQIRTSRSIGQPNDQVLNTMYLGKGRISPLFISRIASTRSIMERGLQLMKTSPGLIEKTLQKLLQDRQVQQTLREKGVTEQQVLQYFAQVKQNPEVLVSQSDDVIQLSPSDDGPQPMGMLNTANPFACVIVIIVLLPVLLIVGLLIATLTLVTCLNINNCFNNLMNNILQGLRQP